MSRLSFFSSFIFVPPLAAVMSVHPIHVVEEDDEAFERGMMVVETHGITFVIVHLHAHDSMKRVTEAAQVAVRVHELTAAGHIVVVMGDMNTLSPLDADWHKKEGLVDFLMDPRVRVLWAHVLARCFYISSALKWCTGVVHAWVDFFRYRCQHACRKSTWSRAS